MDRFVSADISPSYPKLLLVARAEAHPRPIPLTNETLQRHMKLSSKEQSQRLSGFEGYRLLYRNASNALKTTIPKSLSDVWHSAGKIKLHSQLEE